MAWCCASGATGCALRRRSRCDQPSRLWYLTAWSGEAARRPCRCTSARTPASCRGPSRPAPSRTRRSGTGACRCARPAAAPRTPPAAWARRPASRASASANSAGSFLGARPCVRDRDDARDDARAVGGDAAQDRLGVLARQLALRRVVRCRPRCRGSGSGRAAPSRRPPRRSRALSLRTCDVPGIGADCGVFFKLNHLLRYVMAKLLSLRSFLRCWFRPAPLRARVAMWIGWRTRVGLGAVPLRDWSPPGLLAGWW